jgi:hypothetical protein
MKNGNKTMVVGSNPTTRKGNSKILKQNLLMTKLIDPVNVVQGKSIHQMAPEGTPPPSMLMSE